MSITTRIIEETRSVIGCYEFIRNIWDDGLVIYDIIEQDFTSHCIYFGYHIPGYNQP